MIKKFLFVVLMILFFISIQIELFATTVEYIGKPEGIISTNENFFSDFRNLLPGDVKEDYINIKNSANNEIEIFFKTECPDDQSLDLISTLDLEINLSHNGEVKKLYDGKLISNDLKNYISLGKFKKSYEGKLYFKIKVPYSLNNNYANKNGKIKWIFMVEDYEIVIDESEGGGNTGTEATDDDNFVIEKQSVINIKTGDNIIIYLGILVSSIIMVIILIFIKCKDKNKQNNEEQ